MKIKLKKRNFNSRYAITFGETAILHVGGKEFGSKTHNYKGYYYCKERFQNF